MMPPRLKKKLGTILKRWRSKPHKIEEEEEEEDLYRFYKRTENVYQFKDYLSFQPEINEEIREIMIGYLTEVHGLFSLEQEILFLAINIIDRFLCVERMALGELKLVGIVALIIACKYEQQDVPASLQFVHAPPDEDLNDIQIRVNSMEEKVLNKIGWKLMVPTIYHFLLEFLGDDLNNDNNVLKSMACYFGELGMNDYETNCFYSPSTIAASALYVARCSLNKKKSHWNENLTSSTGYSEPQLKICGRNLVRLGRLARKGKMEKIYHKYCDDKWDAVALLAV